jgi:hypothetical protein
LGYIVYSIKRVIFKLWANWPTVAPSYSEYRNYRAKTFYIRYVESVKIAFFSEFNYSANVLMLMFKISYLKESQWLLSRKVVELLLIQEVYVAHKPSFFECIRTQRTDVVIIRMKIIYQNTTHKIAHFGCSFHYSQKDHRIISQRQKTNFSVAFLYKKTRNFILFN